jgi:hypothetical protein
MPQQTGPIAAPADFPSEIAASQLRELQARREMLSDQYQTVMSERGRIGQERMNAQARGDATMVKEYDGTIARLGTQLKRLEATIGDLDTALERAMQAPVIADVAPTVPNAFTMITPPHDLSAELAAQKNAFVRYMVAEGMILLSIGALLWRFGFARGRRTTVQELRPAPSAAHDSERLQQSVDAIAIEVERLSEGQRFINQLVSAGRPERDAIPVRVRTGNTPTDGTYVTPH